MTTTMQAAVYYGARDIRLERLPIPEPGQGEVLVRVLRSGICGTDASEWVGGPKVFPVTHAHPVTGHVGPFIPGHEFVGEVVEAGRELPFPVAAGDLVASGAGVWCGSCDRCAEGRTNMCANYNTLGLNRHGGLAEFVAAPVRTLRPIPQGLPLDEAALAQPLAVGIHAARRSGARPGDKVVIVGGGAIGSFVLAGLKHLMSVDVTVVDFPGIKLERALRLGANRVVEAGKNVNQEIIAALGGNPDVVIEASGAPGQLNNAIKLVRRGGRILAVGIPKHNPEIDIHTLIFSEITLDSTLAHICDEDLDVALRILAEGTVGRELLEKVVSLAELAPSLEDLAAGKVDGKILIDPAVPVWPVRRPTSNARRTSSMPTDIPKSRQEEPHETPHK
jgi:(R,R)-butanediol dehydrogenase/meso-butanediol dehydrogenase/diacetyl reductase